MTIWPTFQHRQVKTGLVQGGVLSPVLFNYYLADFPTPTGENRIGTRRSSVSSALQLLSGRLSNTDRSGTRRSSVSSALQLLSGRLSNTDR